MDDLITRNTEAYCELSKKRSHTLQIGEHQTPPFPKDGSSSHQSSPIRSASVISPMIIPQGGGFTSILESNPSRRFSRQNDLTTCVNSGVPPCYRYGRSERELVATAGSIEYSDILLRYQHHLAILRLRCYLALPTIGDSRSLRPAYRTRRHSADSLRAEP